MTDDGRNAASDFPAIPAREHLAIEQFIDSALPAELRKLAGIWRGHTAPDAPIPGKAQLSLHRLGTLLPYIAIFERTAPHEYRIRLAGSEVEAWFDRRMTGVDPLTLTPPEQRARVETVYQNVLDKPCGFYICEVLIFARGKRAQATTLKLPLCDTEGNVRYFIAGYRFSAGEYTVSHAGQAPAIHHQIDRVGYIDIGFGIPA